MSTASVAQAPRTEPVASPPLMRFGAFLHTLDEMDILPAAIDHMRRIGVDVIYLLDYGSTDGSLEYIADVERAGDIWLLHPKPEEAEDVWDQICIELAGAAGLDWVLFLDADELWLPASGSLHDLRGLTDSDVLSVARYNVVLGADGLEMPASLTPSAYGGTLLHARPFPDARGHLRDRPEEPWITGFLEPKVMARPRAIASLQPGDHDIDVADGRAWRKAVAEDILIAHVPFRTLEQFERKATNVKKAISAVPHHFTNGLGWQWVRWAQALDEGWAGEEFERQRTDHAELEALRATGEVRSAKEILGRLIPALRSEEDFTWSVRRAQPWLAAAGVVCRREGIPADSRMASMARGLYPTVMVPPGHVIKFYGPWGDGHDTFRVEIEALAIVGRKPDLPAPRLVAHGVLEDDWRYVVLSAVPGITLSEVRGMLSVDDMVRTASWVGRFVGQLHSIELEPQEAEAGAAYFNALITERRALAPSVIAQRGVLPQHLSTQLDAWLPSAAELTVTPEHAVLIHADLHDDHVLGELDDGRFHPTGVIDFNRARVAHPMYELGPIWRWALLGDGNLLEPFLDQAGYEDHDDPAFPRRALAWCLLHEGVQQDPIDLPGVQDVATLDELAERSFRGAASTHRAQTPPMALPPAGMDTGS